MRPRIAALLALLASGCVAPSRPPGPLAPSAEPASARSVPELAAAIAAAAQRSDHEADASVRVQLAAQAGADAAACIAQAPQAVPCLYGNALALGLQARAHPAQALGLLNAMLSNLATAGAADPDYDEAGPARVRALVLLRAPGWPLGPGDAAAGLLAARSAVALHPQYPPNLLALAEALERTGDANEARETYARARSAAQQLPASADRDAWLEQAEAGLRQLETGRQHP
jgi:tetratricopeptide (TPR) repeat protein